MNTERTDRMRAAMERQELDALLCRLPENVLLLSGYWPLCGWVFYLFPADGRPVCILPNSEEKEACADLWGSECIVYPYGTIDAGDQFEEIQKALRQSREGKGWKRIGFEGNFENIAPAWNVAELFIPAGRTARLLAEVFGEESLVDSTNFIHEQRARKTVYEIQKLRIANEISNIALETFSRVVHPGVSGVELASAVESAVMLKGTDYRGARRVRAFTQIAVGPGETSIGYRPMEVTTSRRLEDSEIALLELAVVADGFWSDRTRAEVAGEPTDQQREVNKILKKAQDEALKVIRPGISGGEVDRAARQIIDAAGYTEQFMHVMGHGVGFGYHELMPRIAPGSIDVLREGMVHSVEPGIYFPEMGGLRIEDNVLVTSDGGEVLGPFNRNLSDVG